MKNTVRILVLLLALIMVLPLVVACGTEGGNENTTTQSNETEEGTKNPGAESNPSGGSEDETDPPELGNFIEEQHWGDVEITVVGRASTFAAFDQFEVYREEYDPSDIVGAQVYNRNEVMAETYGMIVFENKVESVASYASPLLGAQDPAVGDLLIYIPSTIQAYASMGYFVDMNTLEYINLEHDCWHHSTTEEITFGGKLFYNTSKFLLQDKLRTYFLIYNRDLARTQKYDYLEDTYLATNTWTLENFAKLKKDFTHELDGVDGTSAGDAWGLCGDGQNSFAVFCFGAGLTQSVLDSDGYPVLTGATERMVDIVDTCASVVLGSDAKGWYIEGGKIAATETLKSASQVHLAGNALFHSTFPSVFETAYNVGVPFEYGFMPFPKFDDQQENYISTPNYGNGSIFAIPYTVADPEMMGYFVQAISEQSIDTSYYTFIEEKCKLEDSYDQRCADSLNIVFDNIRYDLAAMNNYGSLYKLVNSTIPTLPTVSYATVYPSFAPLAEAEIQKIKEAYNSLG